MPYKLPIVAAARVRRTRHDVERKRSRVARAEDVAKWMTARALRRYVVITRAHGRAFRDARIDAPLERAIRVDPGDVSASRFLGHLERLDDLVYGPRGLALPRWALYDCALTPGAIVGFAARADDLSASARAALRVEGGCDADEPVPLSACFLVPMMAQGAFWCDALASVNQAAPGAAPAGLRRLSLVVGLNGLGARALYAATQWRSPNLAVYASLGPLRIESAFTPAHSRPATLVFYVPRGARGWVAKRGARAMPRKGRSVDVDDLASLEALQVEIERGRRVRVVGAPVQIGGTVRVPIASP